MVRVWACVCVCVIHSFTMTLLALILWSMLTPLLCSGCQVTQCLAVSTHSGVTRAPPQLRVG